jgi:hypothetical protein
MGIASMVFTSTPSAFAIGTSWSNADMKWSVYAPARNKSLRKNAFASDRIPPNADPASAEFTIGIVVGVLTHVERLQFDRE